MIETTFTPWASLGGGVLIGLASTLLMATLGRVMGATGILAGFFRPASPADWGWRIAVLAGMVSAPLALRLVTGEMPESQAPTSLAAMILGGLIVGFGVTYSSGCTSGHGVCGLARLSLRSLAATATFMAVTAATVFATRHLSGA